MLRTIANFPNYYVSSSGEIWSKNRKRFLKGSVTNWGYIKVALYRNQKRYFRFVHHLVLETFVELRPDNKVCRHLDGNPANNHLTNLRWGTLSENQQDSLRHGTFHGKLTETQKGLIGCIWATGKYSQKEIAGLFNVTQSNISYLVNRDKSKKEVELEKSIPV